MTINVRAGLFVKYSSENSCSFEFKLGILIYDIFTIHDICAC